MPRITAADIVEDDAGELATLADACAITEEEATARGRPCGKDGEMALRRELHRLEL